MSKIQDLMAFIILTGVDDSQEIIRVDTIKRVRSVLDSSGCCLFLDRDVVEVKEATNVVFQKIAASIEERIKKEEDYVSDMFKKFGLDKI